MPNESEFEAVVSEADVEAGVMPTSGELGSSNQTSSGNQSTQSSGWSIFSISGLQKVPSSGV